MKYNPEKHHRRSTRLKDYDYAQSGFYFITICTHNKECLFGDVVDEGMRLNKLGEIVLSCWNDLPNHYKNIELDAFVVMPNYVHGIIVINDADDVGGLKPPLQRLRTIIRYSKSFVVLKRFLLVESTKCVTHLVYLPGNVIITNTLFEMKMIWSKSGNTL